MGKWTFLLSVYCATALMLLATGAGEHAWLSAVLCGYGLARVL